MAEQVDAQVRWSAGARKVKVESTQGVDHDVLVERAFEYRRVAIQLLCRGIREERRKVMVVFGPATDEGWRGLGGSRCGSRANQLVRD
jgi:hypothetical protein